MEYFLLKSNVKVPPQPIRLDEKIYQYRLSKEVYDKLPNSEICYFRFEEDIEIPELIVTPTFMVGETLKNLIGLYDESVSWKSLYFMPDEEEKVMEGTIRYWIPNLPKVRCLHEETEVQPNGAVTNLILDKRFLRNVDIFQIEETQENMVLVSLALAESISRRHMYGVRLERVEVK